MRQLSTQSKWQPWKGFVLQAVTVLLLMFVGGYMQSAWGMLGLALTEIMFLALAVIYVIAKKTPLKEVFPIKKISVRDFFGTVFLWAGGLLLGMCSIYFMGLLLPDMFAEVTSGLNGIVNSVNPIISFIIVGIMPAICEEAIERGAVLSHFRSFKHKWAIVLVIAIFFGIIHLDPIRFINTSILGGICAYLMVKKDNFILPMLLHFINNSFSSIASLLANSAGSSEATQSAVTAAMSDMNYLLASALVTACLAPALIYIGTRLINPKFDKKNATKEQLKKRSNRVLAETLVVVGLCGTMLVSGIVMLVNNPSYKANYEEIMNKMQTATEAVNDSTEQ